MARRRGAARGGGKRRSTGLLGTVHLTGSGGEVETSEGTFRVSERGLCGAMDGDRVYVGLASGHGGGRRAIVEHVVERATDSIVGTFEPAGPLGAVRPLDTRIRNDFFVLPEDDSPARLDVAAGDIVAARILTYPSRQESGVVTLERRIGGVDAPSLGIEYVMARYGLSDGYPEAAVAEAEALGLDVEAALADPLRRDIRDRFLLTIDPVDARDFDDAISIERTPEGGWELGVHIADVSHYVAWGGTLDLEARRRGTSVYLADRVLPMLPERLCNGLCSLNPGEDRLTMTVDMQLDRRGRVEGYTMYPSVIRSRLRLDYGVVDELLQGGTGGEAGERAVKDARACGVDLVGFLQAADDLAEARRRIRRARGAIDFDTVEVHALLDGEGTPVELTSRRRTAGTGLIEEAMLLANECVAEYLSDRVVTTAYRVHEPPSPDKLAGAARVLVELGAVDTELAAGISAGEPEAIEQAVEAAHGTSFEPLVSALLLRAQQRAHYLPRNNGHFALGARAYCHFTSPIRRYPDLLVHRALKVELARERLGERAARERAPALTGRGSECAERTMPHLCRAASTAERTADAAAKASQKVEVARYYGSRLGERALGTVSWVSEMGAFVRLDGTSAEGLLRMADLGGDEWWDYDEDRMRIVGTQTGAVITLGERMEVEVARVNVLRGHVDLRLVRTLDGN